MAKPPEWLDLAQIVTTIGVQGELKVRPETDDPLGLKELVSVSAKLIDGTRETLAIERVAQRKDGTVIAKFGGYDTPEVAAKLRQAWLQVPYAEAKRKPGQVLYADVLGLQAVDAETGAPLGTVNDIYRAGQDLLEIRTPGGKDVLVPWVDQFVAAIDLEAQVVRIKAMEGLFD